MAITIDAKKAFVNFQQIPQANEKCNENRGIFSFLI